MIREWGSTQTERSRAYPGDHVLPQSSRKADVYYRAVSIAAPRATVFRWLCQLRVAPYSYDWVDNLGRQSPRELTPGMENLEVGQRFMALFDLLSFERDRYISIRARPGLALFLGEVVMTYVVEDEGEGTRLLLKINMLYPRPPYGWLVGLMLPTGDFIAARKQLLTLKALAEAHAPSRIAGAIPAETVPR